MLTEYVKNWQILIDTFPYPVCVVDMECNIVMANRAMKEIYSTPDDFKETKCYRIFHNSDGPIEHCPLKKTLKSLEHEEVEIYEVY